MALCITDQADFATHPIATATWGYLRLHRVDYSAPMLTDWAHRLREQPWQEA